MSDEFVARAAYSVFAIELVSALLTGDDDPYGSIDDSQAWRPVGQLLARQVAGLLEEKYGLEDAVDRLNGLHQKNTDILACAQLDGT